MEESTEEVLKPAADRTKIVLSIQDKAETKQYRIFAVRSTLCHCAAFSFCISKMVFIAYLLLHLEVGCLGALG